MRKPIRYNLEPHIIRPTVKLNKYRPARNKQSDTRTEKYRMLNKTYRTALQDKYTTHNRVIEPQPIAGRTGDTLNRIGHNRAGCSGNTHTAKYL